MPETPQIALAVHGGAFAIPDEQVEAHRRGCRQALRVGLGMLRAGASSLDAVEAAVVVLEDDPAFDAGRGSFLNEDGVVELDAGIMDGRLLRTGSIGAVIGVPNPIVLARRVLESEHAVLVGPGARRFALQQGVPTCLPEALVCEREQARWAASDGQTANWAADLFGDTVGAVALDATGNLAAATSTGGSPRKPPGRVGDSPFIGAGLYADNDAGAVSTTGHGELIIPLVWAKSAADIVRSGASAAEAAQGAVAELARLNARGGLVIVDPAGGVGVAWNTPRMAFAYWDHRTDQILDGPGE